MISFGVSDSAVRQTIIQAWAQLKDKGWDATPMTVEDVCAWAFRRLSRDGFTVGQCQQVQAALRRNQVDGECLDQLTEQVRAHRHINQRY